MKKENNKTKILRYVIGSIVLGATTAIIVPRVLPAFSGRINKFLIKRHNKANDNDDWGPIIERKISSKEDVNDN